MNEFSMNTKSKEFSDITRNAFDKNGDLYDLDYQIKIMDINPPSFGYGAIDVGKELKFAGVLSDKILFTHKQWYKDIIKHLEMNEAIDVLQHIKGNVFLGIDYIDSRFHKASKSFLISYKSKIYLLGLTMDKASKITITRITTLYNRGDYQETINYINKSFLLGNIIYKNKKSNRFLSSFPISCRGLFKKSITNCYYKHKKK